MVANWNKDGSAAAPPHELNVWKFAESRAPELQSLHSIVSQRLDNNFQSQRSKRRRTTGHDDRVARRKCRKRRGGVGDLDKIDNVRKDESRLPRRVRRRIELKKNASSGFLTSGDGTKRLRTHVWHAKRFTMTKAWGFHIPLGHHGRGRGSRALLKKLKHGVLVHDASYYGCVQLAGSEDLLVSVLSSMLVPSPLSCSKDTWNSIVDGACFGTAMIHHIGKPRGQPIAPVTYMWRPLQQIPTNEEELSMDVLDGEQKVSKISAIRQLWIWIHAAAFREAYDALCCASEKLVDTTCSVHCVSREGQIAKLELMGSKVFDLLKKTLLPATSFENSWHLKKCLTDMHDDPASSEKAHIFENGDQITSSTVISLVVKDPRTLTEKVKATVPESKPFGYEECKIKGQTFSSFLENEANRVIENGDLWDATKEVYPPVEESVLCMEKQHQRMEFIRHGQRSSKSQHASDVQYSRVCPILLLKKKNHEDSVTRCSVILPLSWVKAFWNPFILNGAHAIGLREKHWVSCETGLPYFPLDFPDCSAYTSFMAMESNAFSEKASSPPSRRLLENPLPHPWDCVRLTLDKISSRSEISLCKVAELGAQNEKIDKGENSVDGKSGSSHSDSQGISFQGILLRTSYMMNDFLNNTSRNKQLLFPKLWGQKSCLYKFMKDEEFLKQDMAISAVNQGKTLCYLRVLICAYKEGVFEQGAVVCAPHIADIMLWTARSGIENQKLQIPQSLLQLPSGAQLQMHENPTLCESYRWPIGFMTTGFVRGSKKAMAGGLCEASLLSMLREEQWKAFPVRQSKKEIYVLVRNIRSTAYRLGLATIVLEQQEEDVNFM